jgi:hypothetical protein
VSVYGVCRGTDTRWGLSVPVQVDVAINYYGKPYQTMVAIGSLLEHSGQHLDRVYVIKEAKQPEGAGSIDDLLADQDWNVEIFVPKHYFGWGMYLTRLPSRLRTLVATRLRSYRQSFRYQYALERSDKRYLLITHNDMLFEGDVVGPMLSKMLSGDYAGVGDIGACWKCPAYAAGLCPNHQPASLELDHDEAVDLYERFPSEHRTPNVPPLDKVRPVPLPECRLHDWLAMIDTSAYRREARPRGNTEPFGSYYLGDVGVAWFKSMVHKGYGFAQIVGPYRHPWAIQRGGGGHDALFDAGLYAAEEKVARRYYEEHYARP